MALQRLLTNKHQTEFIGEIMRQSEIWFRELDEWESKTQQFQESWLPNDLPSRLTGLDVQHAMLIGNNKVFADLLWRWLMPTS